MKTILSLIISGALIVSGYSQTRNVLVGTNNAVVQPTNFWSADASNARTGLGLGTAATNPASAFQPSSAILSNLATGNGVNLTNITATIFGTNISITNISGLQAALDGKLATNGNAANLANFPSSVLQTNSSLSLFPSGLLRTNGDGSGLTNLPVPALASNVLSTIALEKGGTGATNAAGARTALGGTAVGTNVFTAVDAASARSAIGALGGVVAISNGGSGATTAGEARTNLGIGATNILSVLNVDIEAFPAGSDSGFIVPTAGQTLELAGTNVTTAVPAFYGWSGFQQTAFSAGEARTNMGLTWSGLTNTNASTFRTALEIGTTNVFTIGSVIAQNLTIGSGGGIILQSSLSNASSFRINIGLPWDGLTNSDASSFRTALSLGTAATNPASAFQSSSANLTNLAANNGGSLTNIQSTSIVGIIPASNISTVNFSNLGGTLTIASGGTSATNAANARQNLGSTTVGDALFIATNAAVARTTIGATTVGSSVFTLANPSAVSFLRLNSDNTASALSAVDFRTAIGLGTAATNPASAFQSSSANLTKLSTNNGESLTNIPFASVNGALATNGSAAELTNFPTVPLASNVTGTIAISNGGTGATNAGGARTNLGATTIGNTLFTATNATVGKAALELAPSNNIILNQVDVNKLFVSDGASNGIQFETTGVAAITRTNLGIGAGATNTVGFGKIRIGSELIIEEPVNDGAIITFPSDTDPVVLGAAYWNHGSVRQSLGFSTNLSNFWASVSIAAGRTNLGLPLAALTNTNNVNFLAAFFGANTNPVLFNTNGEVVSPTNFWKAAPISTIVQYQTNVTGTSTNAATNSRNLFLFSLAPSVVGVTNTVTLPTNPATTFEGDRATIIHLATNSANTVTAIRQLGAATNLITLNQVDEAILLMYRSGAWVLSDNISYIEPIFFSGTNAAANAAASRTNLGLGATWLTNDNVTNFLSAIGLGETNNVTFSNVTTSGTLTATSTVTAKTNLVVEGYVNFTTNHTNAIPATPNTPARWLQIRVGTNVFYLPAHQ